MDGDGRGMTTGNERRPRGLAQPSNPPPLRSSSRIRILVWMEGQSGGTSLVEYAAATTTGACRVDNEDAFGVFERSHVFVVADGCGGRSSGKSAANLTVKSFADPRAAASGLAEMDPLASAVLAANA